MAPPPRPYLAMTIAELEAIVERMRDDLNVLDAVRFELGHRSTNRAERLHDRVEQLISERAKGANHRADEDLDLHVRPAGIDQELPRDIDPNAADTTEAFPPTEPTDDAPAAHEAATRPLAPRKRPAKPVDSVADAAPWRIDDESLEAFMNGLEGCDPADKNIHEWFALRRAAEELSLSPGFDQLITLNANTIRELPHQIDVARRVLRQMGGRALLADEVGLGKTIEAGIVLKELAVRGLARRVLIMTPAALVDQWQGELESKFFERFDTPKDADEWRKTPRGITSYQRALQPRHAKAILSHKWDLLIVDEAHKVKNHAAKAYQFLQQIDRNYILLLTATPLQNDLRELYNLVTLLRPGQLGTWPEFKRRYVTQGNVRKAKDPEGLKELTSAVMVRTRRSSVAHALELPPRRPVNPRVELSPDEATLYGATVSFLKSLYREGFVVPTVEEQEEDSARRKRRTGRGIFQPELIRLAQRLCSSSRALADSLERLAEGELVTPEYRGRARDIAAAARRVTTHAKLDALEKVLVDHPGQVIVFSEHLATLALIKEKVQALGRPVVLYQGGLSREERAKRLAAFRANPAAVFVSTRAGTEGLNLQFSNVLVNYELPWNPMVVEQRIGRIHRIGQTREAYIVNLAAAGTIEAHILSLLDQKIRLFELVVGELDVILGKCGGAEDLEVQLGEAWLSAASDNDFAMALDKIGRAIDESREEGFAQERLTSEIAAEDNAMRLERDFSNLTIPARVRLGYGTNALRIARGVEAKREQLMLNVSEVLEALESAVWEDGGISPDYGPCVRLTGLTGRSREVHLIVQADRLPMMLIDIDGDPPALLSGSPSPRAA